MKTETCKLLSFEYFCQISSKSIHTFLSYTVSKLVHFLRHSVVMCDIMSEPTVITVNKVKLCGV